MVTKLDQARMEAMARLLSYGNHMEITAAETTFDTLAVQTVHREFREADEANLLEEKDMHIYDSRPLTDPLHLVRCNACEKPIKASQYSVHAELCRSFNSSEDIGVELDEGAGNKKPPRKGKKKFQAPCTNQGTTTGEQDKFESVDADDVSCSELNFDGNNGMHNSYLSSAPAFADNTIPREISGASNISRNQTADIPAPLATKMYYTNGRHRLRAAISHLYRQTVTEDVSSNPTSKLVQENVMAHSQVINHSKRLNGSQNENIVHQSDICLGHGRNPDQILAQSSELCLGASGGYSSNMSFPNQFRESTLSTNGLTTVNDTAMTTMRQRYQSSPHTLHGNPATLETMQNQQKQNGSVPVV